MAGNGGFHPGMSLGSQRSHGSQGLGEVLWLCPGFRSFPTPGTPIPIPIPFQEFPAPFPSFSRNSQPFPSLAPPSPRIIWDPIPTPFIHPNPGFSQISNFPNSQRFSLFFFLSSSKEKPGNIKSLGIPWIYLFIYNIYKSQGKTGFFPSGHSKGSPWNFSQFPNIPCFILPLSGFWEKLRPGNRPGSAPWEKRLEFREKFGNLPLGAWIQARIPGISHSGQ